MPVDLTTVRDPARLLASLANHSGRIVNTLASLASHTRRVAHTLLAVQPLFDNVTLQRLGAWPPPPKSFKPQVRALLK